MISSKDSKEISGSYYLPYIGETLKIFSGQEKFYYEQYLQYGEVSKTRIMGMDFTLLLSPEANKFVLKDQAYKFSSKMGWGYLEPFFGNSLLLLDGEIHSNRKKILYPSFHGTNLNVLYYNIVKSFNSSMNEWKYHDSISMFSEFYSIILKISCQIVFGNITMQEVGVMEADINQFFNGLKTILRLNIPLTKFGQAISARQRLLSNIAEVIKSRRSNQNNVSPSDVLGLMLGAKDEHGCSLSDKEIEIQILQLLFGGHETLAFLMTWLIYELYVNPKWLSLLREEVSSISKPLEVDSIANHKLPFMDLVIKEIERLYPPVYFIPRGVLEDFNFKGYHVPANEYVMLSPFVTNRSPHIFEDPHSFDPLRFSSEREEGKGNPFAAISYGAGLHRCLGRDLARIEMKVFLIMFLQKFDFKLSHIPDSLKPIMHPRKWHKHFRLTLSPL